MANDKKPVDNNSMTIDGVIDNSASPAPVIVKPPVTPAEPVAGTFQIPSGSSPEQPRVRAKTFSDKGSLLRDPTTDPKNPSRNDPLAYPPSGAARPDESRAAVEPSEPPGLLAKATKWMQDKGIIGGDAELERQVAEQEAEAQAHPGPLVRFGRKLQDALMEHAGAKDMPPEVAQDLHSAIGFGLGQYGVPTEPSSVVKAGTPFGPEGAQAALEGAGLTYKGEVMPGSGVHMFEHPDHPGQTAALKEPFTADQAKVKMDSKLQEFQKPQHLTFDAAGGKEVQAPQGGHAGGGVASEEELARPGRFVKVSRSGQLTDQGKTPDFNLKAGEVGYQVKPNGTATVMDGQETPMHKMAIGRYAQQVFPQKYIDMASAYGKTGGSIVRTRK